MRIAILTLPLHTNYGGILQAYALQHVLQGMGHEVVVIDEEKHFKFSLKRRIEMYVKGKIKRLLLGKNAIIYSPEYYKQLWYARTRHTSRFVNEHVKRKLVGSVNEIGEHDFDAFVVGSDQIWRMRYAKIFPGVENAFLWFTKEWNVKRTAYAASFGTDEWEYNAKETETLALMAHKFDAISVREISGVKLCQEQLGVEAVHMIDPTLLLGAEDYTQLLKADTSSSTGNMMCYVLDRNAEKESLISDVASKKNLTPYHANSSTENPKATLEERVQPPVEQWIQGFRDAEFIVTDSFHACIFSILYKKPFIAIGNKSRGMTRFESLLQTFGLEDRLVSSYDDYKLKEEKILQPIDYERVHHTLNAMRSKSIGFLHDSLG